MRRTIAVALALSVCGPCLAQRWAPLSNAVNSAGNSYTVYIDPSSIRMVGPYVKAWFLSSFQDPQTDPQTGKLWKSNATLQYANCAERTMALKQYVLYPDHESPSIRDLTLRDSELEFSDPTPGSVGVTMLDRVCKARR